MMVMCSGTLTTTMTVTMALSSMGLAAALDQNAVVLPLLLIPIDRVRVFGFATVAQEHPQSQMSFRQMPIMPCVT